MFRLALASSRFASPPFFRSRFVPKVNFSIERIRVYTYPGEKSEFIPPIFPPILILPSLPSSSIFFIYTPTDANRHTLLYPTLLVKTIRPLVNLPPRFSSHIRLTTGKKRGEGGRGGGGERGRTTGIFDLPPDLVQRSNAFRTRSNRSRPNFLHLFYARYRSKARRSFINIVT